MNTDTRDLDLVSRYRNGEIVQGMADSYGISRQRVYQILKKAGVIDQLRKSNLYTCHRCAKEFRRPNCHRKGTFSYCSDECYFAQRGLQSMKLSGTAQRRGNRRARRIVSQFYRLKPENVVHHFDRDQLNNDPANLAVFSTHAEHLAYHHWEDAGCVGFAPSQPVWIR